MLVVLGLLYCGTGTAIASETPDEQQILNAIEQIKTYLLEHQKPDGSWPDPAWQAAPAAAKGGHTALVTWALLQAGQDPFSEPIRKAVQNLLTTEMLGTYNRSLRCMVFAWLAKTVASQKYKKALQADVDFLVKTRLPNGRWTYIHPKIARNRHLATPDRSGQGDNSNTQFAVLALKEAADAGAKVPFALWSEVKNYWLAEQYPDGGFSYRHGEGSPYGSMTAAGLASLFIADEMLRAGRCCTEGYPEHLQKALDWLAENFTAETNPRRSAWWLYWLYSVERVAEASGYRRFGKHDWFAEGTAAILKALREDRLNDLPSARFSGPAFALIFLSKAIAPLVCNKLDYGPGWNPNPLDISRMVRYLETKVFERHLYWQIVDLDSTLEQWHESPLLIVNFRNLKHLKEYKALFERRIYQFCETGGTVLAIASCEAGQRLVTQMQQMVQSIWPERKLTKLPASHPVYSAHFTLPAQKLPLWAVGNGCREYLFVSPQDLSCAWHKQDYRRDNPLFQIAANLYMYASDKSFRKKIEPLTRLPRSTGRPEVILTVARLSHPATSDPCPLAIPLLSRLLVARTGLGLEVRPAATYSDMAFRRVLLISGRGKVTWKPQQVEAVAKFIKQGGFVLADALLGDRRFADSLRQLAASALLVAPRRIGPTDPLITGSFHPAAFDLRRVAYSRALRTRLGPVGPAILEGCRVRGRWVFIISPYDLTNGMSLARPFNSLGYEPDSATRIAANCILYFWKMSQIQPEPR